jgi:hypothetical protein
MPNCFFVAKRHWEGQDLVGGVDLLNQCLERDLGKPAIAADERIFNSRHFLRFETAVSAILADVHMRKASFGALFAAIWRWEPDQIWVGLLLDFNFFAHFDHFGFDEALVEPLVQIAGFDAIADALSESAAKGLLAPDFEGPNSGRAALPIEEIKLAEEKRWGPLKQILERRLTKAYRDCPNDFWLRLAMNEPTDVLTRFLHDLFGKYSNPMEVAELRWKAIKEDHPPYAMAAIVSLEHVLQTCSDPKFLSDVVRIDAGLMTVEDGKLWLGALLVGLRTADFSSLPDR